MVYANHFLIQITTKDQRVVWGAFDEPDANPENLPEFEVIQIVHHRFEHFSHLKKTRLCFMDGRFEYLWFKIMAHAHRYIYSIFHAWNI